MKKSTANYELNEIESFELDGVVFTHKLTTFASVNNGKKHKAGDIISELFLSGKDLIELKFIFGD